MVTRVALTFVDVDLTLLPWADRRGSKAGFYIETQTCHVSLGNTIIIKKSIFEALPWMHEPRKGKSACSYTCSARAYPGIQVGRRRRRWVLHSHIVPRSDSGSSDMDPCRFHSVCLQTHQQIKMYLEHTHQITPWFTRAYLQTVVCRHTRRHWWDPCRWRSSGTAQTDTRCTLPHSTSHGSLSRKHKCDGLIDKTCCCIVGAVTRWWSGWVQIYSVGCSGACECTRRLTNLPLHFNANTILNVYVNVFMCRKEKCDLNLVTSQQGFLV